MSKLVIIGGSSGIGNAILRDQLPDRHCINISRTAPDITSANLEHHSLDVLTDDLPDIEDIETLIYCPGSINLKPIGSLKEADFLEDFNINVIGVVKAIRKYHRKLKKSANPSIVLFSSVAVGRGMAFHSSVAASKGAIEGMTRALAAEFAPTIRVNAIAPTITNTPLASHLLKNEDVIQKMKDRHPLKRIITTEEIAAAVRFLIGPAGVSISGQIINVDAGISAIK